MCSQLLSVSKGRFYPFQRKHAAAVALFLANWLSVFPKGVFFSCAAAVANFLPAGRASPFLCKNKLSAYGAVEISSERQQQQQQPFFCVRGQILQVLSHNKK
jgi:hypothetical protein